MPGKKKPTAKEVAEKIEKDAIEQVESEQKIKKRVSLGVTLNLKPDDSKSFEFVRVDVSNEADSIPGETPEELLKRVSKMTLSDLKSVVAGMASEVPDIKQAFDDMAADSEDD